MASAFDHGQALVHDDGDTGLNLPQRASIDKG